MKLFKKHGFKIIGAIIVVILLMSAIPQGRAFYKTLLILPEFVPNSSFKPINFLTKDPVIKEVQYQSAERTIDADLWLPNTQGKHPAAILHLGVDIDRKDQRVMKLANAFSRSGVAILVPNISSLGRRRILAEAKEDLITSFEYLNSQSNINSKKTGFVGFCASGAIVLLVAEDPKIADQIKFIVTINPYYDLFSLYESLTLRQITDDGQTSQWRPDPKTVEIYNRETINLLGIIKDREILHPYLSFADREILANGNFTKLSEKEEKALSKEGEFTYDLLANKDPNLVSFYENGATTAQKNFVRELSPSTNIANLKAKTYILSDKNNVYIPYTEAEALNNALRDKDHVFAETKLIPAGDLVNTLPAKDYAGEFLKIFGFIWGILSQIS